MRNFEIKDDFYLNGKKLKIISGALHYFRVLPQYWKNRLEKLKSIGCNTVETYIPWNIHEPKKGQFNFKGNNNLVKFIKIAEEIGLYVILRPSPYICAEWDFGGLPFWLLKNTNMRIRSNCPIFIKEVDEYFNELFKYIAPLQITDGGPVLMMQVENEYGSYGNSKSYLKSIKDLMIKHGATVPLFTSDGGWYEALNAGTLLNHNILPTANFGSRTDEQLGSLKTFMEENNIHGPLMCMEFWIGWFNNWGEEFRRRNELDAANELDKILEKGHVNIYMFHGGTNFGFMNGCSYHTEISPQTTSYDYDALLTEWGEPTKKYYAFKNIIYKHIKRNITHNNISNTISKINYGQIPIKEKVSLFNTLDKLSIAKFNEYPLTMENLDQGYGYILYRSALGKKRTIENFKLIDTHDRAQIFINEKLIATQYRETLGENIPLALDKEDFNTLDILVENLGRVNYGPNLISSSQRKGIQGGAMVDIHFHSDWEHYSLPLDNINAIDFTLGYKQNTPSFYKYNFNATNIGDTFLHTDGFGKGCAFINGFNLGRFWDIGPTNYLYIPAPLIKKGNNEIIIFETEGKFNNYITLSDIPKYTS